MTGLTARWLRVAAAVVALAGCGLPGEHRPPGPAVGVVRIGYPTTTLINGQIGEVLRRTDVLARNGLQAEVTGFTYGAPLAEAIAARHIDVAFTSEGPAAQIISRGVPAKIVASLALGGVRSALLVRGASLTRTPADLRGKAVAVPFGSTPHLHLLGWIQAAGLRPGSDVRLVNLGTGELEPALAAGSVEGIAYWEPNVSQIVARLHARSIAEGRYTVAVVMRSELLTGHREAARRFLVAVREATLYMALNKRQVNAWFGEASRIDPLLIHRASLYTPSYSRVRRLEDVDLGITPAMQATFQRSANLYAQLAATKPVDMAKAIDLDLWREAQALEGGWRFEPSSLRMKSR